MMRHVPMSLVCCLVAAGSVTGRADEPAPKVAPVAIAPSALEWREIPGIPGVMVALVWGAWNEAHGGFTRFPATKVLPLHKHTATVRVAVVSGTYVYSTEGGPPKHYPAGSFVLTPGGTPHVAGCSDACVYYEEMDGKADFVPVNATK